MRDLIFYVLLWYKNLGTTGCLIHFIFWFSLNHSSISSIDILKLSGHVLPSVNGFKIQPSIFLILNPIFELLRDIFWENELTKSPSGICQGILHSISSILTYYGPQTDIPIKSYIRLKLKKNFSVKKHFVSTSGGTRHVDSNSPTPLASSPGVATCPTRQSHWRVPFKNRPPRKSFKTVPFWELVSKNNLVWEIYREVVL